MEVTRNELAQLLKDAERAHGDTSASLGSATRTGRPGMPATSSTGSPSGELAEVGASAG